MSCVRPKISNKDTYDEDAVIQVISDVDMFKSLPMNEEMTIVAPAKIDGIATPIVAVKTKMISCAVDLKHIGRSFGFGSSSDVNEAMSGLCCFS